jgi:adenylylsulfate kinase
MGSNDAGAPDIHFGQRPVVAWLTGLPGSGKTTLAAEASRVLAAAGRQVFVLDGDDLRRGLCSNLGFSAKDRTENMRRTAETARLMARAGLIVIVALISPFRTDRARARLIVGAFPFLEVFVDTPLAVCRARDPKGLYAQAEAGEVPAFTGVSAPYEIPEAPDLRLWTEGATVAISAAPLHAVLLQLSAVV